VKQPGRIIKGKPHKQQTINMTTVNMKNLLVMLTKTILRVTAMFTTPRWSSPINRRQLRALVLGVGLFTGLLTSAEAAVVTLNANDAGGTSSYNTAGNWSSAAAPSAGNTYVVNLNANGLRGPVDGGVVNTSYNFWGDSLEIQSSGQFLLKFLPTAAVTQTLSQNLILSGGRVNYGPNATTYASVGKLTGTVSLTALTTSTLCANGNGGSYLEVNAPISGSGNLTIGLAGNAGSVVLSGSSSYDGTTSVSLNFLRITDGNALGSTVGGTTVASGAALEIQGGITVGAEALTLNGTGIASGGALRNKINDNTFGGLVTLGSASRINSDSGTLNLSNTGTITGAGLGLTVGGAGNTTIASIIGTTSGTLTKDGAGTLTRFLGGHGHHFEWHQHAGHPTGCGYHHQHREYGHHSCRGNFEYWFWPDL
jgi:autotransporter-associated beta strand protein